ncbi:phage antirepressor KilAC domain-containing protein [Planobispora rosea]|uniref:phage antirepressor KilAC domain-containing protein n=1 Tax=Planobispora rosea TaxID=35762 RepID=UPI00083B0361|nr:phage antirepressor KilAC domain-containing protein [Planobispora rosea]
MNEIAFLESRTLRQEYADRAGVLEAVKPLRKMTDDLHVTTEMVAAYFEVGVEAIKSLVKDNRSELEANEYRVLEGDELRSFKDLCGIAGRGRSMALFTRRTVLNVGMLLRDSEVARKVRTYLLDSERQQRPMLPQDLPTALRALADEMEAHHQTRAELENEKPLAEAYRDLMDADGTFDWAATAQIFAKLTGGLGRNNFLDLLRGDDLKILKANNTPYQFNGMDRYFKVRPVKGGKNAEAVTRVTPEGLDWLRRRLIKHFNPQTALFPVGEIA